MIKVNELVKSLNNLYDYGETEVEVILQYLVDLKFLIRKLDRIIISKKWVAYSRELCREDFIPALLCFYPPLLENLLIKVYREAVVIGKSGDGHAVFEFVDSLPFFANTLFTLKNKEPNETEEIKSFYQAIFGGYPHYQVAMTKLKALQKTEEKEEIDCPEMGISPNENWVTGRKISSNIDIDMLEVKRKYLLTPYQYRDFQVGKEIAKVLSNPWYTFTVVLCMIVSEYNAEGFEGVSIRPTDKNNPYFLQPLDIFIYDIKGRELKVGTLREFTYEFCIKSDFSLFPDKVPDIDKIVFSLMEEDYLTYKDGEYVLATDFKDLIYSKDIMIKNRSRKFKNLIKDYIEKLRNTL